MIDATMLATAGAIVTGAAAIEFAIALHLKAHYRKLSARKPRRRTTL